jgi:quercetin dioxygenase-like cupin family protein
MAEADETFARKRFEDPDAQSDFTNGHSETVTINGARILRVTFEPGFRWTNDVATPRNPRCPYQHRLHILSGALGIQLPDGSEQELRAGDVVFLAPDHDSWTMGDEPVVFLDFVPLSP